MAKRPTMNDIAAACGLSIFTVSKALNDASGVSPTSRKKVLDAARTLGYVPHTAARALRTQAPGPVIVLTASTSNYYYIDLLDGLQEGLREAGLPVRIVDLAPAGRFDTTVEADAVQEAMQARATGVISTLSLTPQNYERLNDWGIPVVFVDSDPPESESGAASVTTDNAESTARVGDHLAHHGYRRWVLLIYPARWSTRESREAGLRAAAARAGAELTVLETENDPDSARSVLTSYLSTDPDHFALIVGNNPLLHGALDALSEAGRSVPHDVPLVTFDEFPWAAHIRPPLTVVDEHSRAIGVRAAHRLTSVLRRRDDPAAPEVLYIPEDREEVQAHLIIRESCGCDPVRTDAH